MYAKHKNKWIGFVLLFMKEDNIEKGLANEDDDDEDRRGTAIKFECV